jgi:hypothetical protein
MISEAVKRFPHKLIHQVSDCVALTSRLIDKLMGKQHIFSRVELKIKQLQHDLSHDRCMMRPRRKFDSRSMKCSRSSVHSAAREAIFYTHASIRYLLFPSSICFSDGRCLAHLRVISELLFLPLSLFYKTFIDGTVLQLALLEVFSCTEYRIELSIDYR